MIFHRRGYPSDMVVLMAGVSHHAAGVFVQLPGRVIRAGAVTMLLLSPTTLERKGKVLVMQALPLTSCMPGKQ